MNLTCLFLTLPSCTCHHLMLRILLAAPWWNASSFFRFFADTFHVSQPHSSAFRGQDTYMLDKIPKQLIFRILFCDFLYMWAPSHYSVFVFSHSVLCVSVTFGFFGFYTIILTGAQNILLSAC